MSKVVSMMECSPHPLLALVVDCGSLDEDLFDEISSLRLIKHVACYVVIERGELLVQRKAVNPVARLFGSCSTRIQSFGGCDFPNSIYRMINSLRLELLDEAGLVLSNQNLVRASNLHLICNSDDDVTLVQVLLVKDDVVPLLWSAEVARKNLGTDLVPPEAGSLQFDAIPPLVRQAGQCIETLSLAEPIGKSGWRTCDFESLLQLQDVIASLRNGECKDALELVVPHSAVSKLRLKQLERLREIFNSNLFSPLRAFSMQPWMPMLWTEAKSQLEDEKFIKKLIVAKKSSR